MGHRVPGVENKAARILASTWKPTKVILLFYYFLTSYISYLC
jgi:hypothetical protein